MHKYMHTYKYTHTQPHMPCTCTRTCRWAAAGRRRRRINERRRVKGCPPMRGGESKAAVTDGQRHIDGRRGGAGQRRIGGRRRADGRSPHMGGRRLIDPSGGAASTGGGEPVGDGTASMGATE